MTNEQILESLNSLYPTLHHFETKPFQEEISDLNEFFVVRSSYNIDRTDRGTLRQQVYVNYITTDIHHIGIDPSKVIETLNKKGLYFVKSDEELGSLAGLDKEALMITFTFSRQYIGCI